MRGENRRGGRTSPAHHFGARRPRRARRSRS